MGAAQAQSSGTPCDGARRCGGARARGVQSLSAANCRGVRAAVWRQHAAAGRAAVQHGVGAADFRHAAAAVPCGASDGVRRGRD